ncbi:MAG: hypothetical protein KGH61_00760 [Candidatus Micrarchaeota archaeon]|nr:hypothetical protein [Candidatus Micrarchaeota archaeon]MDE1847467.1 hypothetical protein [Candidatus Micrarchaeota archaeon]MDE1864038.1 hypothetical protein [Candidatus Micrarchaeota archaeon]
MVAEDINFLDLACLLRIGPDTVMEKFGGLINTSFFDASTIAGTLKQKGLIEFTNNYPGPNGILISQLGKSLIAEAESKGNEPFDTLDSTILQQMSGGKRIPLELGNSLSIRSRDLAMRLYKLYKQNYIIYDLKNGSVELLLTEGGFLKIRSMQPGAFQNVAQQQAAQGTAAEVQQQKTAQQAEALSHQAHSMGRMVGVYAVAVIIVIVAVLVLFKFGYL